MSSPAVGRARLGGLMVARAVDQGVLGLSTLWLAARFGPVDFAPIGVLLVVNSLAVQVSDFGVGFRVLRAEPDEYLDVGGLRRLRIANLAACAAALAIGAVLGGTPGVVVAASGFLWVASAEGYVRKAGCLKSVGSAPVVRAEITSSTLFGLGALAVGVWRWDVGVLAALLVTKHLVEIVLTRRGLDRFRPGGLPVRSSAEWLGQVLTYLVANVDFVAVSALLGAADLSRYLIGFRMASAAPTLLAGPVMQVSFVTLAGKAVDDVERVVGELVRRAFRYGAVGSVFALAAAVVLPPLLGPEWAGTGVVTAILACAVPWRMLLGLTVSMALTAGWPQAIVRWEAIRLGVTGVAVLAMATISIDAVAAAVAMTTVAGVTLEHVGAARLLGVQPRREVVVGAIAAVPFIALLSAVLAAVV